MIEADIIKTYSEVLDWYKYKHSFTVAELYMPQSELFRMCAWLYLNEQPDDGKARCGTKTRTLRKHWMVKSGLTYMCENDASDYKFKTTSYEVVNKYFMDRGFVIINNSNTKPSSLINLTNAWITRIPDKVCSLKDMTLMTIDDTNYIQVFSTLNITCIDKINRSILSLNHLTNEERNKALDFLIDNNKEDTIRAVVKENFDSLMLWSRELVEHSSVRLLNYLIPDTTYIKEQLNIADSLGLSSSDTSLLLQTKQINITAQIELPTL